jgi:cytochrome c
MQKFVLAVAAATLTFAHGAGAAEPQAGEALVSRNGCLACHGVDQKIIGPGFKEIGAKYRGDTGAAGGLADKVKAGSKGIWGDIPMPPNAHLKDDDIKAIIDWILALK